MYAALLCTRTLLRVPLVSRGSSCAPLARGSILNPQAQNLVQGPASVSALNIISESLWIRLLPMVKNESLNPLEGGAGCMGHMPSAQRPSLPQHKPRDTFLKLTPPSVLAAFT